MTNKFEIEGYHGTFKENVNNILKEGYNSNIRDDHWLGQGIYFYKNIELAKWFITRKCGGRQGKSICIIKSNMETNNEKVLDLDTDDGINFVFEKINEQMEQINITFDKADETKNRCIVLDIIKEYYNIDIIIKTFQTKYQSYGGANIRWFEKHYFPIGLNYNETQICATDNMCIKTKIELDNQEDYKEPKKILFNKNKKR